MRHRATADQTQEWRENLAEIYSLIRQQQRILFRTQAVAEALLATLRALKVEGFEQTFEAQYHQALAGKVAEAQSIAISSLDTLIGRLSAQPSKSA